MYCTIPYFLLGTALRSTYPFGKMNIKSMQQFMRSIVTPQNPRYKPIHTVYIENIFIPLYNFTVTRAHQLEKKSDVDEYVKTLLWYVYCILFNSDHPVRRQACTMTFLKQFIAEYCNCSEEHQDSRLAAGGRDAVFKNPFCSKSDCRRSGSNSRTTTNPSSVSKLSKQKPVERNSLIRVLNLCTSCFTGLYRAAASTQILNRSPIISQQQLPYQMGSQMGSGGSDLITNSVRMSGKIMLKSGRFCDTFIQDGCVYKAMKQRNTNTYRMILIGLLISSLKKEVNEYIVGFKNVIFQRKTIPRNTHALIQQTYHSLGDLFTFSGTQTFQTASLQRRVDICVHM